jgi:hypothetical protein
MQLRHARFSVRRKPSVGRLRFPTIGRSQTRHRPRGAAVATEGDSALSSVNPAAAGHISRWRWRSEPSTRYRGALDVHKKIVTACARGPAVDGGRVELIRTFDTSLRELEALEAWLTSTGVTQVAMEATGSY